MTAFVKIYLDKGRMPTSLGIHQWKDHNRMYGNDAERMQL